MFYDLNIDTAYTWTFILLIVFCVYVCKYCVYDAYFFM